MSTAAKHPFGGEHPFEHIDNTVYQLMHHGWRKGEEQFRNRIYFTVQADRSEGAPNETEVAAFITKAINSHDDLLAALQGVVDYYAYAEFGPIATARAAIAKAAGTAGSTPA